MERGLHFFGESARYISGDTEQQNDARKYLELWQKFLIQKLNNQCYIVKIVDEQRGEFPPYMRGALCQQAEMWVKVAVQIEFKFEVAPIGANGI
jgi:CRISPR/Cas system-associated endonuclease Cas1